MEQSIRLSSKSRLRNNQTKTKKEETITIKKADYLGVTFHTLALLVVSNVESSVCFTFHTL